MGAVGVLRRMLNIDAGLTRLARARPRAWWASGLIGVGCAACMLLVRAGLSGFYGNVSSFMILLPAVVVAALTGGRTAGVVAVFVSLFGGWVIAGETAIGVGIDTRLGVITTTNFIVVGLFVTIVAASLRKVLWRLDASIDALRQSADRISESENRLHVVSEQAPVMLWMSDETGRCVHLNQALKQFWGLPDVTAATRA